MQIPLLVRGRASHASSADRLLRFRKVLQSAQRTPYHRRSLSTAGLDTSRALRRIHSIEEALPRLPVCEPGSLPPIPRPRCVSSRTLVNPLPSAPPIALAPQIEAGSAPILAGSCSNLVMRAGIVKVQGALIVLTGVREGVLTNDNRDFLWDLFGVPIFEQHIGLDGQLVAHECEAHDGLHIVQHNAVFEEEDQDDGSNELLLTSLTDLELPTLRLRTGFSGQIRSGECACGSSDPRVVNLCSRK